MQKLSTKQNLIQIKPQLSKYQTIIPKAGNSPTKIKNAQQYFTIPFGDKKYYQVTNMKIIRILYEGQNNGITGNITIKQKNNYAIKVIQTQSWGVSLGIKDIKNGEIIKYGGNGWISNCNNTIYSQGKGISSGDVIKIIVDLNKGIIKWQIVNEEKNYFYETKCQNTKIAAKDRNWVPFITMSLKDVIEVIAN